eukprot:1319582-Pyramimonas_sp.AAC.1
MHARVSSRAVGASMLARSHADVTSFTRAVSSSSAGLRAAARRQCLARASLRCARRSQQE